MIANPDNVEVTVALLQFVQEALDSMNGMKKLESVCNYEVISYEPAHIKTFGIP